MKTMLKKKISKRINPSNGNLKWKLNDYIRTQKLQSDEFDKNILNEIQSELDINFNSSAEIDNLEDNFKSKSYFYKQLQNIVNKTNRDPIDRRKRY